LNNLEISADFAVGSSPETQKPPEGTVCSFCVRMLEVVATQVDHFSIASNRSLFILVAVISKKALHQPCLGVMRIDLDNSIEKNLGNVPSFL
jgi:hypothetical protein